MVLLTPGPCQTSNTVRQAGAQPDLNHRSPEFGDLVDEVKKRLSAATASELDWVPYLIGGSGTAAMEAMVTSCVTRDVDSLILANGYYSERMAEIFHVHRLPHWTLTFPWSSGYDLHQVQIALERGVQVVFATQHETTTGRLNNIPELVDLCEKYQVPVFVDAMSSYGADPLPNGIAGFCSSANKCLHGIPGVSFVMLRKEWATRIRNNEALTYYLHLPRYEGNDPPLTPPVPALSALRQALREFPGSELRSIRYREKTRLMECALDLVGSSRMLEPRVRSCALLVAQIPFELTFAEWTERNVSAGFMIYGCKGEYAKNWFQVSPMGEATLEQINNWCSFVNAQNRT